MKKFFKSLQIHHYIVFALILALGVFNAVTALEPTIKQHNRERNIVKTFNAWWNEEGAARFTAVGLTPNEKIKEEEFAQYRERYLKQNHTFIVEDRIEEMRKEFREWWEINGGKEEYIKEHNVYPDEKIFEAECHKWIKRYKDKHIRYRLAYVPKEAEYDRVFTSWLLFPGFFSFLIFAGFFGFAYMQLSRRWGIPVVLGIFIGIAIAGGFIADGLTATSFFYHGATERYMGASMALAFLLGGTAFGLQKDAVPKLTQIIAFAGFALNMIIDWFVNGGIFVAVALTSIVMFGLGVLAGTKIPNRRKSRRELLAEALEERKKRNESRNPAAERKVKIREQIKEGFQEASKGRFPAAIDLIGPALTSMLQEYPIDKAAITELVQKMVRPDFYVDVPSTQWLEWGGTAKTKSCFEAALLLLEKGLAHEKNVTIARRTLYNIGEIRILQNMEPEEGKKRLQKVVELGNNDILALQAKRLLERKV